MSGGLSQNAPAFETPKKSAHDYDRSPGELHLSDFGHNQRMNPYASPPSQQSQAQLQSQSHSQSTAPREEGYPSGTGPNILLQQATPQGQSFTSPTSSNSSNVPGILQPGSGAGAGTATGTGASSSRSPSTTTYTASRTVPTMPPLNTNAQQYSPSARPTLGSSHSHSRSSPAGMDQKYIPFSATTPIKSYSPQTPNMAMSHSPLGLSDIRPRTQGDYSHDSYSTNHVFDHPPSQTKCNYQAPWATYAFDWCKWPVHNGNGCGKMAVASYLEDPHNFIQIVDTQVVPQEVTSPGAPPYALDFVKVAEATCAYPVTRISWEPPSSSKQSTDLLATSGDHLRLWSLPQSHQSAISNNINRSSAVNQRDPVAQKLQPLALLSNSKTPEHTAPLTSLDWNTLSPKLIITSSIDTTCTIWDIPTLTAKTQLIAHDKEVFDVRFCAGSIDVFVSCGADGSVRMFDLRSLEHSTIIYEPSDKTEKVDKVSPPGVPTSPTKPSHTLSTAPPLLRLAASPHDAHLLATFAADSNVIRILDARQPGTALLELRGHAAALNSIEWNPSRRGMLASGADDSLVLVWDLLNASNSTGVNGGSAHGDSQAKGPSASWRCDYEVNNISWAPQSALTGQGGDWLGAVGGRGVWGVKL
ncbi:hypothetical protein AAFC00_006409 [Neodothiora populina]